MPIETEADMTATAKKDVHAVGSADWVRMQISQVLRGQDFYPWIRDVFPDSVIVENEVDGSLYEVAYQVSGTEIVISGLQEVSVEYVAKHESGPELTGPIVAKDEAKRIVYAPVLVPDEADSDGDVVSAEKIEQVAHTWMESYQNLDLEHTLNNVARPLESYVAPADLAFPGGVVPKGSWVIAARVPEELWPQVVDGRLGGFSLMAVKTDALAAVLKSEDDLVAAWKRTLLADLGDDWVVPFVSLVMEPAVPKAKWVALKSAQHAGGDAGDARIEAGLLTRLGRLLGGEPATKEGRKFSEKTYRHLKAAAEALAALVDEAEKERASKSAIGDEMNEEQVRELVQQAIKDSLTAEILGPVVKATLEAEGFTPAADTTLTDDDAADDTDDGDEPSELDTVKAELEATKSRLDELETGITTILERIPPANSRAIKGQDSDNGATPPAYEPKVKRDSFGRRVIT